MLDSKRWSSWRSIWWGSSWCHFGPGEAGSHNGVGFKNGQTPNSNLRDHEILTIPILRQLLIDDCYAPGNKPDDAYLVLEIQFSDGKAREKNWPAATLVTDLATGINVRYGIRQQRGIYLVRKVVNFKFLRQGQVIRLAYVRRRGWLVGAGQPKEQALILFEGYLDGVGFAAQPVTVNELSHFTAIWVRRVFTRLWLELMRPKHWFPMEYDHWKIIVGRGNAAYKLIVLKA